MKYHCLGELMHHCSLKEDFDIFNQWPVETSLCNFQRYLFTRHYNQFGGIFRERAAADTVPYLLSEIIA